MKILLTGRNGQVGWELERLLPRIGAVIAIDRQQVDFARPESIRSFVRETTPDLIVNAAAYTAVDQAEQEADLARAINTDSPAVLAEEAKRLGIPLVHYSTDYVFDGAQSTPYHESDPPNPLSVYGRTKLKGEQAIRASGCDHLIFRTAWVYATRGRNFLLTILRLAATRDELRIVNDQHGAPTWSRAIATATVRVVERTLAVSYRGNLWGTYHMTAAGETTWYEFARAILENCSEPEDLVPELRERLPESPARATRVVPITTSEYPTPARRPAYSLLSNEKLRAAFSIELPPWTDQLHKAMFG
jgi:dTDP-4-dehydrorhamnose reductase